MLLRFGAGGTSVSPARWEVKLLGHPDRATGRAGPATGLGHRPTAMDRQPHLVGALIELRPLRDDDWERPTIEIGWTFLARAYWGGRFNGK